MDGPLGKIIWRFNCPLTVPQSRRRSSNLLVSKVTKDDAGNYTCAPTNAKADSVMVHVIDGKFHVPISSLTIKQTFPLETKI